VGIPVFALGSFYNWAINWISRAKEAIVLELNARSTMRVEAGWFVTYLEGQRYVLGHTDAGIRPAVREAIQLCSEVRVCGGRLI
jgi:hypothetical protein